MKYGLNASMFIPPKSEVVSDSTFRKIVSMLFDNYSNSIGTEQEKTACNDLLKYIAELK